MAVEVQTRTYPKIDLTPSLNFLFFCKYLSLIRITLSSVSKQKIKPRTAKPMIYQEMLPCVALRPYVNCFWMIHSVNPLSTQDRTFPDGCQEICFNIDTTVLRDDGKGFAANPAVELIGQMTRPYDIVTQGKNLHFGVKFYPHSFSRFTKESIYDLRDRSIDLRDLMGPQFLDIIDKVFEKPTFARFIECMECFFLNVLSLKNPNEKAYAMVSHAVQTLMRMKNHTKIEFLADLVGIGERSLQNMFKHHVGLGPKLLIKMIRFQRTFPYLKNHRYSLTDIAHLCGYYDQAHFTHEFKTFTGVYPSKFRATDYPLNQFFLDENSYAYLCNYRELSDMENTQFI